MVYLHSAVFWIRGPESIARFSIVCHYRVRNYLVQSSSWSRTDRGQKGQLDTVVQQPCLGCWSGDSHPCYHPVAVSNRTVVPQGKGSARPLPKALNLRVLQMLHLGIKSAKTSKPHHFSSWRAQSGRFSARQRGDLGAAARGRRQGTGKLAI